MIYRVNRTLKIGYLGFTAAIFVFALIAILGSSLFVLTAAMSDKKAADRGRELVRQNCYSCHSFKLKNPDPEAPPNGLEIDASRLSDETIRYRLEHPVSGTGAVTKKSDQDAIIKYLRDR